METSIFGILIISLLAIYIITTRINSIRKAVKIESERNKKILDKITLILSNTDIKNHEKFKEYYTLILKKGKSYIKQSKRRMLFKQSDKVKATKELLCDMLHNMLSKKKLLERVDFYISQRTKKIRNFYYTHTKGKNILSNLVQEYGEITDKYIVNFNDSYNYYKNNKIAEYKKLFDDLENAYNDLDFEKIETLYYSLTDLEDSITIELKEPKRLKNKFQEAKNEINILSAEISKSEFSLYTNTLKSLRNCKINKEQSTKWNSIKENINTFNKDRVIKNDILKQAKTLRDIVYSMKELKEEIMILQLQEAS